MRRHAQRGVHERSVGREPKGAGARGRGGGGGAPARGQQRGVLRVGIPAVPRRPAAPRGRPRRRASRGRARATGRAARAALRAVRGPPGAGPSRHEVLLLTTRDRAMVLRAGLLWLSEQPRIFRFVRGNGLARRFASRFVAGETVDDAVAALGRLNAAGICATPDLLGESVRDAAEASAARDVYLTLLDRIAA